MSIPARPALSVVVPTYREAENLRELTERVFAATTKADLRAELLIVDDLSHDGTDEICRDLAREFPIRLITRPVERGLSTAVLLGIHEAVGDVIVVMDADLSHPPEVIPALVQRVRDGADFVVGSRYVKGGSTAVDWGILRWINSQVATLLAAGLTRIKDPMAGFFAFHRQILNPEPVFSPVGYKIGLEILTKARCKRVEEVPIAFAERKRGQSKLTIREQVLYLRHLRRLYRFTYPQAAELIQFGIVGLSGAIMDLLLFLTLTGPVRLHHQTARAVSFIAAASSNWFLNRWFTFVGGQTRRAGRQWAEFLFAALFGFLINWGTYKLLTDYVPFMAAHKLVPFAIGIVLGSGFNYMSSRLFVFRPFEEQIGGRKPPPVNEKVT